MNVNVRSVDVGRVGVCMLCVCDIEELEDGVGTGVNDTMMSETLKIVGFTDATGRAFGLKKKNHELVCMRYRGA